MSETPWKVRKNAYAQFDNEVNNTIPVIHHPLEEESKLPEIWIKKKAKQVVDEISYDFEDPLGATNNNEEIDEIDRENLIETKCRSLSLDNTLENRKSEKIEFDIELPDFQPWREKRAQMMLESKPKDWATNKKEILNLRLKNIEEMSFNKNGSVSSSVNVGTNLTSQIMSFKDALHQSWTRGDRVETFRIVADVAKIPKKLDANQDGYLYHWLNIIDIFDVFGKLVYDRLFQRANEERNKLGQSELPMRSFCTEQIPRSVQDIAKHWFIKITEIGDIFERIYVETSLIECLRFLDNDQMRINLERLAALCTKLPNDTSSLFLRVYISRTAMHLDAADRTPHWRLLHDFMQTKNDLMELGISPNLSETALKRRRIHQLAISWILQCVSYGAHTIDDLAPMWHYCQKTPINEKTYILLTSSIEGLSAKYLTMHSRIILEMIFSLKHSFEEPMIQLGRRFSTILLSDDDAKFVKRIIFKRIGDVANFDLFVRCSTEWSKFVARNFEANELSDVLEMIVMRLKLDDEKVKKTENFDNLVKLVMAFLDNSHSKQDCLKMLNNSNFTLMLDLIGDETKKASKLSKQILECLVKRFKPRSILDLTTCYFIIDQSTNICKYLGYKVTDEVSLCEELISQSLMLMDLKSRKNKMTSVEILIKARASLGLRQRVVEKIVDILIELTTFSCATMERGAKRAEFLRICITNLAITTPAIHDAEKKFRLTLKIVQLCIFANYLPQMDDSCRRALETLEEITRSTNPDVHKISQLISQFLALLIFVPDSTKRSKPLYYYHKTVELIEVTEEAELFKGKDECLAEIWIGCLRYLCTMRAVGERDSLRRGNDVFYAGNQDFLKMVDEKIDETMAKLLALANDPMIAVLILENVIQLFDITEEIRSTLRGLLKRAHGMTKSEKRLKEAIEDLKKKDGIDDILNKLGIL